MENALYNGIELPALPEWNTSKFPYACIVLSSDGSTYHFSVHAGKMVRESSYKISGRTYYACVHTSKVANQYYQIVDGKWELYLEGNATSILEYSRSSESNSPGPKLVWTNKNVLYYLSSQVYFAGSEPVPLPPTVSSLTPDSMLAGWYAGKRMALMHQGR